MKLLPTTVAILAVLAVLLESQVASAKKPSRKPSTSSRRSSKPPPSSKKAPVSRRPKYVEEDEEVEDETDDLLDLPADEEEFFVEEEDEDESTSPYDDEIAPPTKRKGPGPKSRKQPPPRSQARKRAPPRYEDEDDYYRPRPKSSRGPPSRRPHPSGGRTKQGSLVRYSKQQGGAATAFTKGLAAIRSSMPDPSSVKDAALSSISTARKATSSISANLYREVKGLTSSELEQVMLKATKPDDTPVKGKHVERLVGVTYQIGPKFDIYDAVLRKLWGKMVERDWRTTMKAVYIMHRFSADGAPEHAAALKARLRELRRTRDPKRKDKFFNTKQLLAGDTTPENVKFRAFLSRYSHYVLLRTQCYGGMFDEIAVLPKSDKKKAPKPITSTCLRVEQLESAAVLLKAGLACQLKDGEECENTALAVERVVADMIGLCSAVAVALNRALKDDDLKGADPAILKKWCAFYSKELLPQTKLMVKKTSPKLDAFGLFLPSRMGTTVAPDILEKGMNLDEETVNEEGETVEANEASKSAEEEETKSEQEAEAKPAVREEKSISSSVEEAVEEEEAIGDEYEYDDEDYYDDEEEE
ncbi:hypothetical protein FisN_1Lh618 [Fistulifera solaris]|uniref:ENTH domain-containing protein n=1 Tax=Fistulifera solaris TaxID=1519565 RepID=A0A1Z5K193_FISSO|nr:hypothetical protein FisN_1Lh618 [Fistulifera solaris]|eukprot:GAX19912.1 hypothetical protein FisN_1Lh618 [Fistulifera solaris]